MSAARLIAALLAVCGSALFGAVSNSRAEERIKNTDRLVSDVDEMYSLLRIDRMPLHEIASRLSEKGELPALWANVEAEMEAGASLKEALNDIKLPGPGSAAARFAGYLTDGFPAGDAETESARIGYALEKLKAYRESAINEQKEKGRLTSSLSLMLGLAAAILIL